MSFPRYPRYKHSGAEWLDDLPDHWGFSRLRWLSRRYSGGTPDKAILAYWENGSIPWLNSGAVNDCLITEPSTYITPEAFANSSAKWIPRGSLVMALAGQGKTKGMVAQLEIDSTCNQSMAAIIPGPEIAARFLFWWLDSNYQNVRNMAGGDLRDGLNLELLGNICCPLPPLREQEFIASFLDRETAKIDALVAEQRRLIELLKEKRQAVISHAVTKGLNPTAPMKPSGIAWPVQVPAHWEVLPLTRVVRKFVDYRGVTPQKLDEGVIPLITTTQVKDGRIDHSLDPVFISEEEYEARMTRGFPERGDVIITTEAPLGEVAQIEDDRVSPGQRIILMKVNPAKITQAYLFTHFRSQFGHKELWIRASGSTASGIRADRLRASTVLVPPIAEQERIVRFIEDEIGHLPPIEEAARQQMALLQERRTALISATVTGQIDVRGLVQAEAA